jgi:acetyl-CoA carboxylase biotin carboxyl carrier protein
MDIRKLKKLIELVEESDIAELEIRDAEESVRIARHRPAAAPVQAAISVPAPQAAAPGVAAVTPAEAEAAPAPEGHVISSPMVGTFYAASSPGARPFVSIGDRVKPGDTLCIIEAMKILNQIEADAAGTVRAITAEDAQPVEFGQPLFVLDPS